MSTSDDAGVYRLAASSRPVGLVQTVDFFTPIVDEPYDWGRIAAANALSDVYAMGGTPLTALQLIGWPRDTLGFDLAAEVVRGGIDVMAEAGCTIVGGHSIDDAEPTYGFAVTGIVELDAVVTNAAARPGDLLVLTKPLGTGIVTTAVKAGACPPDVRDESVAVMAGLNRRAAEVMRAHDVVAATDVTGFGLLGHLGEMLHSSGVAAIIDSDRVPVLAGVGELLAAGHYPSGSARNLAAAEPTLDGGDAMTRRLLADAQTSGGLLLSVAPDRVEGLVADLREDGVHAAAVIGEIVPGTAGRIRLR